MKQATGHQIYPCPQKKIQKYHMAGLRETRNSRMDEQLEKLQHLDQSKSMC